MQLRAIGVGSDGSEDSTTARRVGDASNPNHVVLQIPGRLMETLVDIGDYIEKDQAVAFVKQMKMEIEIRSPRAGKVKWAYALDEEKEEDGENVEEGLLLVEFEAEEQPVRTKAPVHRGKL